MAGISLSDYLLAAIKEIGQPPTLAELRGRLQRQARFAGRPDTAPLLGTGRRSAVMVLEAIEGF
jgi:hypothetical protein